MIEHVPTVVKKVIKNGNAQTHAFRGKTSMIVAKSFDFVFSHSLPFLSKGQVVNFDIEYFNKLCSVFFLDRVSPTLDDVVALSGKDSERNVCSLFLKVSGGSVDVERNPNIVGVSGVKKCVDSC